MNRINPSPELSRRHLLRGAGTLLALPLFDSLLPAAEVKAAKKPARFVAMYHPNGVNPYKWYPTAPGAAYEMPENLAVLKDFREDLTVFSGLAHFRVPQNAGHWGLSNLLTGYGNGAGKKYGNSMSIDQVLAPHLGAETRFQSLNLSRGSGVGALNQDIVTMSFGRRGSPIPAESSPRKVFQRLFVEPTAEAKARFAHLQEEDRSILDSVLGDARSLKRRLGRRDQEKLDDYFSNIRRVETGMRREAEWLDVPRYEVEPKTRERLLAEDRYDYDLMLELIGLALVSDTTRVITFVQMQEPGLYHGASHWNKNPKELLPIMDEWDTKWLGGLQRLATTLRQHEEGDGTLLDRTTIVYGGGHGRRPHYTHDLPLLLLGGRDFGFKHGQHLAFGPDKEVKTESTDLNEFIRKRGDFKQTPLANLYVSVATAMGVDLPAFADSNGYLNGLV